MNEIDLATVTFADFNAHLNKEFTVTFQGGTWPFVLSFGSERDGEYPSSLKRRPFTVTFTSPPGLNLGQGIMEFSQPDFGHMEIFTVPVGWADPVQGTNSPVLYQACFN